MTSRTNMYFLLNFIKNVIEVLVCKSFIIRVELYYLTQQIEFDKPPLKLTWPTCQAYMFSLQ